jgi:divalent metal cation (Fe/Co/Zn/Cd) transporter
MTVLVSIYIVIGGIRLIKETISPLIGEAPDHNLVKNITEEILKFEGVLGIHDLIIHTYGPGKTFITVHVEVDSNDSVLISHSLVDRIEKYINEKYNTNLVIHMDPIEIQDEYTNQVKEEISKILNNIDSTLKFHDFRVVKGTKHDNIIFDLEYPENFKMSEKELEEVIKNKIELINPRLRLIIEFDIIFKEGN